MDQSKLVCLVTETVDIIGSTKNLMLTLKSFTGSALSLWQIIAFYECD